MSNPNEHQWKEVPPTSMYDTLYECTQCGQKHFESMDNPDSYLPKTGTEKAMCSGGVIHKSLMVIPKDSETAQVLETLKTGEAMNLQKVANLMGVPSPMIKDGLTQQFLSDLDKYLAETFCSILPTPNTGAEK